MKFRSCFILCSVVSIGFSMPIECVPYRKKYQSYRPREVKNDSVRNLTKVGLGVGLLVLSGVAGHYTYATGCEMVNQGSVAQKGISGAFWAWWGAEKPAETEQNILKKFGIAVFLGMVSALSGASGLRLVHQGLAAPQED